MAGQTFNDSQIDRSVGTLLLLLIFIGIFVLAVIGMQSVRTQAESLSDTQPKSQVEQPVYDIAN